MIKHNKTYIVFIFCLFFSIETLAQSKGDIQKATRYQSTFIDLQKDLDDIFNDPNFNNANWGVVIQSLETGEYLYKRDENKSFMPASNMKIFTTATALTLLGPDYRYLTKLMTNGSIENNTLKGDLIIRGSGDPTFPPRTKNSELTQLFNSWADSLKGLGIKMIQGNIVGDDKCFDNQRMGVGWSWDDETYWYSAYMSGLTFNDNCIDLTVGPGEFVGSTAKITLNPNTKYVTIKNEIRTTMQDSSAELDYYRKPSTNLIKAFGQYPLKAPQRIESITIDNPALYTATVFKEVLESKGISIQGDPVYIDDYNITKGNTTVFQTLNSNLSIPLADIIKNINKKSHNLYAEQILKTVGKEIGGIGSISKSTEIEKKFLTKVGIDPDRIIIVDGSGLSRLDLVTPSQIVTLLSYMYRHKYWKEFYNSLPIAGVDGTISDRMKGTRAANNVHAKTGYVNYVRALSGYLTTKDGEMLVFSMIVNHYTVPTSLANNIQDLVCVRLANFSRK